MMMRSEGCIRHRLVRWGFGVVMALSLTACGTVFGESDEMAHPASTIGAGDPAGIPYKVELDVIGDTSLGGLIEQSSELRRLNDSLPLTLSRLELRAERDKETFEKVLRSEGYYAGDISYEINRDAQPIDIQFKVDTGPPYALTAYDIVYTGAEKPVCPKCAPAALNLDLGQRALAVKIVDAQGMVVRRLEEIGFPLAEVSDRKAVADHDEKTIRVTLTVDQGLRANYGAIAVEGAESVSEDYIRRLVPLGFGDEYDQNDVDKARTRLVNTDLFEMARIEHADAVDSVGNIPLTVRLRERLHRSFGGNLGYSSTEGARAEVFWEHRNLFSNNEKLRFTGTAAEIEQGLTLDFNKPHFLILDQNLKAGLSGTRRTTEAFDERSVLSAVSLDRPLFDHWRVSPGASAEYSIVTEDKVDATVLLFGLPLKASRDDTDDLLNPTEGSRLALSLTPYYGTLERHVTFVNATVGGSTYYAFDEAGSYVVAGRAKLGTIQGAESQSIPAPKRLYAGGGGSVRGYGFQKVGPLDGNGDPNGGRSLLEIGTELRIMVTDTIGIVPFIDGGMVYEDSHPDSLDLLWAAGIGARYYTSLGPFRVDFAFPINGRKSDDPFQFYVSIGQAF